MASRSSPTLIVREQSYLDFLRTLRLGAILRSSFAIFALAVCLLLRSADLLAFNPLPLVLVILAELLVNQAWPWLLRRIRTVEGLKHLSLVHIILDIAAISLTIYLAGGLRVAFINLAYLFLILWAGFFISARACYITAFGSALAYGVVLLIHYTQQYQPFYVTVNAPYVLVEPESLSLGTLYLAAGLGHAAALLLIAYFGAKAHDLLLATERAHQTTVALKADLDQTFRQLVRSEKLAATGELAAGMAHEIYNPLTAIAGLAESLLLSHMNVPPKIADTLNTIRTQAERACDVVRRLLGFARPAEPHLAPYQLNDVITESLAMVRYKADLHKISIELELDRQLPPLIGDHSQIQEVCVNLMLNAVQAMPNGGHLRLVSRLVDPDCVELQVTDTGCGIPATHLPRIFDPFFTTKTPGEGTGLGLSVTHSIIQRHCGTIDVKSQPGRGTTFFIRLPMDPTKAAAAGAEPAATVIDLSKSMAEPSILVVDDDAVVCQMLAQFLVDNGYQVTTACTGTEALRLAHEASPDLVLLDLRMPGMNGQECLQQLKALHPDLPVVMVTAVDDEAMAEHCLAAGAVEYLVKPISLGYLRTVLTVHLRRPPPSKIQAS